MGQLSEALDRAEETILDGFSGLYIRSGSLDGLAVCNIIIGHRAFIGKRFELVRDVRGQGVFDRPSPMRVSSQEI